MLYIQTLADAAMPQLIPDGLNAAEPAVILCIAGAICVSAIAATIAILSAERKKKNSGNYAIRDTENPDDNFTDKQGD